MVCVCERACVRVDLVKKCIWSEPAFLLHYLCLFKPHLATVAALEHGRIQWDAKTTTTPPATTKPSPHGDHGL